MAKTINVLFLAAEAEPFFKVGGLADVAGSLPLALRDLPEQAARGLKLDVRLVLPLHRSNKAEPATLRPVAEFPVWHSGGAIKTQVFEGALGGMPVYFINGAPIASSATVYLPDQAQDRAKYGFFSMAALEMTRYLEWQPNIVHANDWHTALALYAINSRRKNPAFGAIRTMLTVHNLPFMGGEGADVLAAYGLEPIHEQALPSWAWNQPLPLGLHSADAIVPVSPTYAREILTPEFGCGLEAYLRGRANAVTGILNGLDVKSWDPAVDRSLVTTFSVESLSGREANKAALQKELGLPVEARLPILAMIGRVDPQKGVDISLAALSLIAEQPWQFILLGTGDKTLEEAARNLQLVFPDRIRAVTRYDSDLGRKIYGGADLFLMPSRYEPCGLAQMIAMRYGCVPVVRTTGGLKDTVQEGKTGFMFDKAMPESLADALMRALGVYVNPEKWKRFQRNGMKEDFSWSKSARQYAILYRSLISLS